MVVAMLAFFVLCIGLFGVRANASPQPNVVISQVQVGPTGSASNEFIELYNNTDTDIDISNWCLFYASATSITTGTKMFCFVPENNSLHLFLPQRASAFLISTQLATAMPSLGSDGKFTGTILATAGHIRLIGSTANVVDKIGWGTSAVSPETSAAIAPQNTKVLSRKMVSATILVDTDNNLVDIESVTPKSSYSYGAIYEIQDICQNIIDIQHAAPTGWSVDDTATCLPPPIDICTNIDGIQIDVPIGYLLDESGNCVRDMCSNITGLQTNIPADKEQVGTQCLSHDVCRNIVAIQPALPDGYRVDAAEDCWLELLPLVISELMPNAVGVDAGNEFIELYNPHMVSVELGSYLLIIGTSPVKSYTFPTDSRIAPMSYMLFSNDDIAFTLTNTSSQVTLQSSDNQFIDSAPAYIEAAEGVSWALIDSVWQYTNTPTPGAPNHASRIDDVEAVATGLKPCPVGQFRNPDTNRCRLITTALSALTACRDGQYRSETTNRCRSIAADSLSLATCQPGQVRNPSTNRCKSTASDGGLVACKPGQERSADTNRCRNVKAASIPEAAFAVEPVADTAGAITWWWALGGLSVLALGYGIWEWRQEIKKWILKLPTFFQSQK